MADRKKVNHDTIRLRGIARYPRVNRPDAKKSEKASKFADDKYSITLVLPGDFDTAAFLATEEKTLLAEDRPFNAKKHKSLLKEGDDETDKDGKPIDELQGKYLLKAKSKYPPAVYDKKKNPQQTYDLEGNTVLEATAGKPIGKLEVYGGDEVEVILTPGVCDMPQKNTVFFRLNAVRIIQKNSSGSRDYSDAWGDDEDEDEDDDEGGEITTSPSGDEVDNLF